MGATLKTFYFLFFIFYVHTIFPQQLLSKNELLELKLLESKERKSLNDAENLFYLENDKEAAYKLSHQLLKRLKTDASKSRLDHLISCYFLELKRDTDSALFYSKKTLSYTTFSNDSIMRMRTLMGNMSLASTFLSKGLFKKAKKVAIEGQEKAGKWNFIEEHDRFILYLGDIYSYEKKFNTAINLFQKIIHSIDIDVAVGSMMSLGRIYHDLKDYKKSNKYYNQALEVNENPYYDLAVSFYMTKNLKYTGRKNEIIPQLKKIIKRGEAMEISHLKNQAKKELINEYLARKKFDQVEAMLLPLVKERKQEGNLIELLFCYDKLKENALNKDDYKQALGYTEEFLIIQDSINKIQKAQEINELEIKFETLQKEQENDQLKKDKEKQIYIKNLILIASTILFAFILLLALGYYKKLKTQKKLNETLKQVSNEQINSLMKEQELKLIKATIEGQDRERKKLAQGLHDSIGNDIATIKLLIGEIKTSEIKKIQNHMDRTYQKVREMSHNTIPKKNRHNDYIEILKEYVKNIDEATDLKINFEASEEEIINQIDVSIQNEIFIIQQELITNTLKHAKAKHIDIRIECILDTIHLTYEDDGKGFSMDSLKNNKGIGITNIKNRIDQLSGSIIIDSHPKRGTLFKIEIKKDAIDVAIDSV
ncbi:tetratricopeptide repeat-containing sensor histidine kinase [Aquimarina agarilytica]|uniref:tetratricopeptide repeat-containing sensor histidine kinase n=1 Tax=Aquimarina agarilytica TaxID=1087449 RepID=UPI0002893D8E|nr:tetratricopeptide repeat-containing sensor histidine kinase [Aquimarina agarilytica]